MRLPRRTRRLHSAVYRYTARHRSRHLPSSVQLQPRPSSLAAQLARDGVHGINIGSALATAARIRALSKVQRVMLMKLAEQLELASAPAVDNGPTSGKPRARRGVQLLQVLPLALRPRLALPLLLLSLAAGQQLPFAAASAAGGIAAVGGGRGQLQARSPSRRQAGLRRHDGDWEAMRAALITEAFGEMPTRTKPDFVFNPSASRPRAVGGATAGIGPNTTTLVWTIQDGGLELNATVFSSWPQNLGQKIAPFFVCVSASGSASRFGVRLIKLFAMIPETVCLEPSPETCHPILAPWQVLLSQHLGHVCRGLPGE